MDDPGLITQITLPVALATIMWALGLSLTIADFKRVLIVPRGVAIGMANLLLLSPLLGFAIAELYGLDPLLAVGLVVMASAPGGTMAALLTHLARGETALSVTMTGLSSTLAVVTMPFYLGLAIRHFDAGIGDDVRVLGVAARVFAITIVPVSLGMYLRSRRTAWVVEHEPRIKRFTLIVFVLVVLGAVISEFDTITEHFGELALATLTLNVAAMTIAFTVSRFAGLSERQTTAIALELGVHNSTLAIAVATTIATVLATPAAVYSVFMFVTASAFTRVMWARNGRLPAQT
ncbi:MAG: bile acid:Na+ symporter, family [Solirubrobacteraceae bacterium]|nr:bile acid:Na+ symporter, family [Solirubrobacteraceae bacterium]